MLNRLKVFGPTLVAVCAMGAAAASAASALTGEIEVEGGGSATVTGEQVAGNVTEVATSKHEFKTDAGVIKCTPATFHGVATNGSKESTLTPTYGNTTAGTGCTIAGIAGPVVHMNGCSYRAVLSVSIPPAISAGVHLTCPPGNVVDITIPFCTITISPQTIVASTTTISNAGGAGSAMDANAVSDITGIDYVEHTTGGSGCPNGGGNTTTKTNGTYKGVTTFKGETVGGGAAKGVTVK